MKERLETCWIFCAGMRRSASTLQYHLAREIAGDLDLGWVTWQKFDDLFDEHDGRQRFAVLKTHAFIPDFSDKARTLFGNGRGKTILIHRDIRDVVASALRMRPHWKFSYADLAQETAAIMYEVDSWSRCNNVLISTYDKVVTDIATESRRIADFLGVDKNEEFHQSMAEKYSVVAQKERQPLIEWDKDTLLWPDHISPTKTGLTDRQRKTVEDVAGDWLKRWGYE